MKPHPSITARALKTYNTLESRFNIKHDHKYDYSNAVYLDSSTKIEIYCNHHGLFLQTSNKHLGGKGCPKCGTNRSAQSHLSNTVLFISKANNKHDNFYDYTQVNYIHSKKKVNIICPIHGLFEQTPNNHLRGHKCPKCALIIRDYNGLWGLETYRGRKTTLYYIKVNNLYKIGLTMETLEKRFKKDIGKVEIQVIKTWDFNDGADAYIKEQEILSNFFDYRYLGENILTSGNTELFVKNVLSI